MGLRAWREHEVTSDMEKMYANNGSAELPPLHKFTPDKGCKFNLTQRVLLNKNDLIDIVAAAAMVLGFGLLRVVGIATVLLQDPREQRERRLAAERRDRERRARRVGVTPHRGGTDDRSAERVMLKIDETRGGSGGDWEDGSGSSRPGRERGRSGCHSGRGRPSRR